MVGRGRVCDSSLLRRGTTSRTERKMQVEVVQPDCRRPARHQEQSGQEKEPCGHARTGGPGAGETTSSGWRIRVSVGTSRPRPASQIQSAVHLAIFTPSTVTVFHSRQSRLRKTYCGRGLPVPGGRLPLPPPPLRREEKTRLTSSREVVPLTTSRSASL